MNPTTDSPGRSNTRKNRLHVVARDFCAWLHIHRGPRAELRRCSSVAAIALTPGFHHLRAQLDHAQLHVDDYRWTAVAAGVLAQVNEGAVSTHIVETMAKAPKGGRAPVSGLRFRRLLATKEPDDLLTHLRRAVRLVNGTASAGSIMVATDAWRSDWLRMTWAARYYSHAPSDEA